MLQDGCYNLASTRLAILYNSDATSDSFTNAFTKDVYFDACRTSSSSTTFNSFFTTGISLSASGTPNQYYWSVTSGGADLCARFDTGSWSWTGLTYFGVWERFKSCSCTNDKNWICEYKL
jgi:hypothetical protein